MTNKWGDWFVDNISSLEEKLGYILELRRVRELWLQGELYLLSNDEQCFDLNKTGIVPGGEVDIVGDSPKMIAELKVCGRGYHKKMLNGISLTEELSSRTEFTLENMKHHDDKEGSIFKDFCRLDAVDSSYERYMILVIPKLVEQDTLGTILETVKFPGKEFTRKLEYFDIRVFQLT
ncbi:hypothetical protein [Alkalimarinus alittae]|uniref:Uncharacterized protein n=1 Tax=Alkalimarinus alittae TaxID=2961619 RepID=A0ABY6MXB0_9ALTE|nr:hypothetical protein [Alkalimarinus alittae]UZE94429.1 hypothetical protein NKI27_10005 [Alkalimarinus alittae]